MPLYPLWPVAGLIALAYVLYVSALDPELGQPSLIANGVLVVLALCLILCKISALSAHVTSERGNCSTRCAGKSALHHDPPW